MITRVKLIEDRFNCKIEASLISDVLEFLENTSVNDNNKEKAYQSKEEEDSILDFFIESKNLYYNDLPFSVYLDEGAEQKVFYREETNKVLKLNDAIFYVNWSQYFEALIIHNLIFPNTKYELLGFVKINKVIYAAVEQEYIVPDQKTEIESIQKLMISKGFSIKKKNDYVHTELGLIIEDLHEENVLVRNKTLFFIDTVIYLK